MRILRKISAGLIYFLPNLNVLTDCDSFYEITTPSADKKKKINEIKSNRKFGDDSCVVRFALCFPSRTILTEAE